MRAYICDACNLHVQPEQVGADIPPKGWHSVTNYDKQPYTKHVCSTTCLVTYAQDQFTLDHPPAPVPEPMPEAEPMPERYDEGIVAGENYHG